MKLPVHVAILLVPAVVAFAQTEGARISGRVTDPTDAVIVGAQCTITNIETNVSIATITNEDGIYVIADLRPATYKLIIQKEGFRTVIQPSLQLYVQDAVDKNFRLAIGPTSESVTVLDEAPVLRTDSAAVSTVVNQQFVQNMPLNGRSFQSLIALTPGVRSNSGAPLALRFRSSRNPAPINSMARRSTICETIFSMPEIGLTRRRFPNLRSARMISAARLAVPS
jgi:hypothetical protein